MITSQKIVPAILSKGVEKNRWFFLNIPKSFDNSRAAKRFVRSLNYGFYRLMHLFKRATVRASSYDRLPYSGLFCSVEISGTLDKVIASEGSRFSSIKEQAKHPKKPIAIILGYFNGKSFIADQLQSIFKQSYTALHVYLWDDQSSHPLNVDELKFEAEMLPKLSIQTRPDNVGFAANFLDALANIDDPFAYFAFSDQDDVWHPDKLERAVKGLSEIATDVPALYCARTEIVDATCTQTLATSPIFEKPPSFANALVQNIGGGNTMVFNKAARDLIVASLLNANADVIFHDWWCYQIVTGAGGYVVYDPKPCLKYRQHPNNMVGSNSSWQARFLRIRGLLQGRLRKWNDINLNALLAQKHLLTTNNLRVLNDFRAARQSNLFKRLMLFRRSGVHRQTLFGSLGLLLGIFLNKV